MNNFTQHGITHLSASSINAYAEDPAYWTAKYLLGAKFPFSAPARGGTIIEKAIVECLQGKDKTKAIDDAIAEYNKATIFEKSDAVTKWSNAMRDMIEAGVSELSPYGTPKFELDGSQKKILIDCNMGEYKVPVIGFLDLFYPEKKVVVDIKCTFRCPSEMSPSHKRQAAIYQLSNLDCQIGFLYLTPKKTQWFWVQDVAEQITEIKGIIRRMNGMLGVGDAQKIKEIIPIVDSFYWGDCMATRKELFGF